MEYNFRNGAIIGAIAAIVLVILLIISTNMLPDRHDWMTSQGAWDYGCSKVTARGCLQDDFSPETAIVIEGYDPDGDGKYNTITDACRAVFGLESADECWIQCCGE